MTEQTRWERTAPDDAEPHPDVDRRDPDTGLRDEAATTSLGA